MEISGEDDFPVPTISSKLTIGAYRRDNSSQTGLEIKQLKKLIKTARILKDRNEVIKMNQNNSILRSELKSTTFEN